MRFLILLCAALMLMASPKAQTPKYKYTNWTPSYAGGGYSFYSGNPEKIQTIYKPSNFAGMPSGKITAIYLRIGDTIKYYTPNPTIYPNLRLSIGYTNGIGFNPPPVKKDTFMTGLINVLNKSTYSIYGADTPVKWIKFTTDSTFTYDGQRNFVVEISHGKQPNGVNGIYWMATEQDFTRYATLLGWQDSVVGSVDLQHGLLDLGFDIEANTGVDQVTNITSIGLFPNPSTNGRFMLSFDTKAAVKKAVVTAASITGQKVWSREYTNTGTSFFKEMDMSALPKGTYAIRIEADGEALSRTVIIQ